MDRTPEQNFNPAVSVIIPCYNHGRYIREAIVSVEQCDSTLYEIIIINDGSTDAQTLTVMADLQAEGYQVITQENQGCAASRNKGISLACGRYILPLDADNKIYPEYIPLGIKILDRQPEVAVVYGRPELFGDISTREYPEVFDFDLHRLIVNNYIDTCAVIRKSAVLECNGYDTHVPHNTWEDWDLWLSLAAKGWEFHFEDARLFSYRILANSLIGSLTQPDAIQQNMEYLCRKHALLLREIVIELQTEMSDHPRALYYSRLWAEQGVRGLVPQALAEVVRRLKGRFGSAVSEFRATPLPTKDRFRNR